MDAYSCGGGATTAGSMQENLKYNRKQSIRSQKAHKTAFVARSSLSNPDLFNKMLAAASCSVLERIAERSGATVDTHVC